MQVQVEAHGLEVLQMNRATQSSEAHSLSQEVISWRQVQVAATGVGPTRAAASRATRAKVIRARFMGFSLLKLEEEGFLRVVYQQQCYSTSPG
jgi:hypothetical protein